MQITPSFSIGDHRIDVDLPDDGAVVRVYRVPEILDPSGYWHAITPHGEVPVIPPCLGSQQTKLLELVFDPIRARVEVCDPLIAGQLTFHTPPAPVED